MAGGCSFVSERAYSCLSRASPPSIHTTNLKFKALALTEGELPNRPFDIHPPAAVLHFCATLNAACIANAPLPHSLHTLIHLQARSASTRGIPEDPRPRSTFPRVALPQHSRSPLLAAHAIIRLSYPRSVERLPDLLSLEPPHADGRCHPRT